MAWEYQMLVVQVIAPLELYPFKDSSEVVQTILDQGI